MGTIMHASLCVRGAIDWPAKLRAGLFRHEDGSKVSPRDARNYLLDRLAEGKELLPIGEPCEGFDYKTGCPGHEPEPETEAKR